MRPADGTVSVTRWILEAQLTSGGSWQLMEGFTFGTREELQAVYEKFFRHIEGRGCRYRFAKLTETQEWSTFLADPAPAGPLQPDEDGCEQWTPGAAERDAIRGTS